MMSVTVFITHSLSLSVRFLQLDGGHTRRLKYRRSDDDGLEVRLPINSSVLGTFIESQAQGSSLKLKACQPESL